MNHFHGKYNGNNEAYARSLKYFLGMVIYPSLVINLFTIAYTNIPHYKAIFVNIQTYFTSKSLLLISVLTVAIVTIHLLT